MSFKSAVFIEDIAVSLHNQTNMSDYKRAVNEGFNNAALNCFGAVGLYIACLVFCLTQVYFNVELSKLNTKPVNTSNGSAATDDMKIGTNIN